MREGTICPISRQSLMMAAIVAGTVRSSPDGWFTPVTGHRNHNQMNRLVHNPEQH